MRVNLDELSPWADIHKAISNMRSLTVMAGGKVYTDGPIDLEIDDFGNVTMDLDGARKKKAKKAA